MDDFSKWLKQESEKEKAEMCRQHENNCDDCPYSEDCEYEEVINSLDEW